MTLDEVSYTDHKNRLVTDYRLYDDGVSCVAAWHYILTQFQYYKPFTRHFEWFPRDIPSSGAYKTPDFTALLTKGAVIGEVKSGACPTDDKSDGLKKLLKQISHYTWIKSIHDAQRELCSFSSPNVVLLARSENAVAFADALINGLDSSRADYPCKVSPIVMSYAFQEQPTETRFVIQRVPMSGNGVFSPLASTEAGKDLHWFFCEKKAQFALPTNTFIKIKSKFTFMNDDPPPIFSAVFLWPSLMQLAITTNGYDPFNRPAHTYYDFLVNVDDLCVWLNERWCPDVAHKSLRKRWIEDGIQFLAEAGLIKLATTNNNSVIVRLQRAIGSRPDGRKSLWPSHDIAQDLADRHALCMTNATKKSEPSYGDSKQPAIPGLN